MHTYIRALRIADSGNYPDDDGWNPSLSHHLPLGRKLVLLHCSTIAAAESVLRNMQPDDLLDVWRVEHMQIAYVQCQPSAASS